MNCSINIISSRTKCIEHSLNSLWENYNFEKKYPVFVYYFDDIYDDIILRKKIISNGQDVRFVKVDYKTPEFIKEEELFYNRMNIGYARTFGLKRKGYLHMCHFNSNMYGYPNTCLEEYEIIMTHDDESGYDKKMIEDPFEALKNSGQMIGAFKVSQRLKEGKPHQGHLDTRVGLWNFTKAFLIKNNVNPKNKKLRNLLKDHNAEWNFHFLEWCDTYVIKTEMFKLDLWKKWIEEVNKCGGIYKYRWGDNEIISLFAHMIQEEILDLRYVDNGYHNQGKYRNIQDIAPSVKDFRR